MARVDVDDIAAAALATLTTSGHERRTDDLLDGVTHTGRSPANDWSRALGREIASGGDDLDAWGRQAGLTLPAWLAFDARLMFAFFQDQGLVGTAADVDRQTMLLGRPPRRFVDLVAETAAAWIAGAPA